MEHLLIFLMFIFFPMISVLGLVLSKNWDQIAIAQMIALVGLLSCAVIFHHQYAAALYR